jgi:hypothetical protein
VDEVVDVKPGGNRVRAYLDVLAPDGVKPEKLFHVLTELAEVLGDLDNPVIFRRGDVTVRFGVEMGLIVRRSEELNALIRALKPLLEGLSL